MTRGAATELGVALVRANARFWPTVFPVVRRELRAWDRRAQAIPDVVLREQALAKLRDERFNTEVAATLATLVPPVRRRDVTEAIVALEVMYDYLDGLTEQPTPRPLAGGRQLYRAFADAVAPAGPPVDHYRHHEHGDDGGYLAALAATCRRALWSLPAAPAVAPVAQAVLARCGEAQTRTHAVARLGPAQLEAWAAAQPEAGLLRWSEVGAGAAASVLAAHALIALAADPATTTADAEAVAAAYLVTCALVTLLDSLIDAEADAVTGGHPYLAYYASEGEAAERLVALARVAVAATERLPRASHHLMTLGGAVAFYLSAPGARAASARRVTAPMVRELRPLLVPPLAIFAAWRAAKRWPLPSRGGGEARTASAAGAAPAAGGRSYAPPMTRLPRLALVAAAGAALLVAPAAASAKRARVPSRPQVKVLGFSTFVRVGIPQIQARPGRTLTACYDGYNGQREVNVVWQGWGIPKNTRMGIALWGGSQYTGSQTEPSDADTMLADRGGFRWSHKKAEKVQVPYGYTFAGGPFGPVPIDGTWTVKILIKGRVVVRKSVTIACA